MEADRDSEGIKRLRLSEDKTADDGDGRNKFEANFGAEIMAGKIRILRQNCDQFLNIWSQMISLQNNLRRLRQRLAIVSGSMEQRGVAVTPVQDPSMAQIEQRINGETTKLERLAEHCADAGDALIANMTALYHDISDEFKLTLQWSCFPANQKAPNISEIQHWFTQLLECLLEVRSRIMNVVLQMCAGESKLYFWEKFERYVKEFDFLYLHLMPHALAVQNQPPEIVKKCTKLKTDFISVKLLCSHKCLGPAQGEPLKVKLTILNEDEAKELYTSRKLPEDVKNSNKGIKYDMNSGAGGDFKFRNVIINEAKRPNTYGKVAGTNQGVLRSPFCFVFHVNLKTVTGNTVEAWCCSRPFILIVNDNQMQEASGVVLWNSMHESPRVPFVMADKVTWSKLSWALNNYIQKRTRGKKKDDPLWSLTERNLRALGTKLFGHPHFCAESVVSSEKFLQRDGQKAFWDWFYQAVKLLKEFNLAKYWNQGYIVGFISREDARSLVASFNTRGIFLIRFSDSQPGSIALSVCSSPGPHDELICKDVGPMNEAELTRLGIEDRLGEVHYQFVCHETESGDVVKSETAAIFVPKAEPEGAKCHDGYERQRIVVCSDFFGSSTQDSYAMIDDESENWCRSVSSRGSAASSDSLSYCIDDAPLLAQCLLAPRKPTGASKTLCQDDQSESEACQVVYPLDLSSSASKGAEDFEIKQQSP